MNRLVAWLALDGSMAKPRDLEACRFETPHWQPDHRAIFADRSMAFSATQRFITPQCQAAPMPYRDDDTGCVINADAYLTNREELRERLRCGPETADGQLILRAYLEWGEGCPRQLSGQFCFLIWAPRARHLFAAVDPFAQCPLFFLHRPGELFVMANECSPFHTLRLGMTLSPERFVQFAKDRHSPTETTFREMRKLPAGHQLVVTELGLRQTRYWHWKHRRQTLPHRTREEYYDALRIHFESAVRKSLRRLGPLTTQVSGGLDSSAVTAQAASLLAKRNERTSAFTIRPRGLDGESYRPGWYYHELPKVEALLARHPNIEHVIYTATPSTDIFEKLRPLQRSFDQPLRNVENLDWTMACYEQVLARGGRVLLMGAGGNGTISWAGQSKRESVKHVYSALKARLRGRRARWIWNLHETMVSGRLTAPLRASVYPLQLWYGVRRLDPTQDLDLSIFCYNVPQWVYRRGKQTLQRRLLAREGLAHLLPIAIAQSPYRGEQGADWYLHYNRHREHWRKQLERSPAAAQKLLWRSYDRRKMIALFNEYPLVDRPDRKITRALCHDLFRCLSMATYLSEALPSPGAP